MKQYEFRDGEFVDVWNFEQYGADATSANPMWFEENFMASESWCEAVLDLCGCVSTHDEIIPALSAYLLRVMVAREQPYGYQVIRDSDRLADLLLACLADERGLTEHGGSIGGSWLTDAGKRWLELSSAVDWAPREGIEPPTT